MKFEVIFNCSVEKYGNSTEENEDFRLIRPNKKGKQKLDLVRCAIADGATMASFSKEWSKLLVVNALATRKVPSHDSLEGVVRKASSQWQQSLKLEDLPWYAVEKAKRGGFSTFLWVSIRQSKHIDKAVLRALAFGDCELIILREGKLYQNYPIKESSEFNSTPKGITSLNPEYNRIPDTVFSETILVKDQIVLATDALAEFLLKELENNNNPLNQLELKIKEDANRNIVFRNWISNLRLENKINNDDSTIVWIRISE